MVSCSIRCFTPSKVVEEEFALLFPSTGRLRGIGIGISEASKRVPIFLFATQGGKQASSYFRQRNLVQAREAHIRFPVG